MHSLAYRIFYFFLSLVICGGFVAIGLLIAVWPATYSRWVRWSNANRRSAWLRRGWDPDQDRYGWQHRQLGIVFVLFGILAFALNVWIVWFQ
jgi:hypothetical protein